MLQNKIIIGPVHDKMSCGYSQTAEASETLAYRNGLKSSLRCTGAPFFGGIRAPKNGFGGVALAVLVLGPLVLAGDAFVGSELTNAYAHELDSYHFLRVFDLWRRNGRRCLVRVRKKGGCQVQKHALA